ncbi:hypothetical protein EOM86_08495 [Candidatus Nomurabacteria bacterium]|nr:hypothetical protein [Candidatus Nomurabacteria bacterium]
MSKITKLGMGINCFEGTEHLKNIIYEIRDAVDVIIVGVQHKSYFGKDIEQEDVDELMKLKSSGYIDEIVWFDIEMPPESIREDSIPRRSETEKRNRIIEELQKRGCSHCLITDSDEFYDGDEFRRAKKVINDDDDIHCTYCQYLNYYRDYHHYLVWPFESFVPFITEIDYRFLFDKGDFQLPSDPTRRYKIPEGRPFEIYIFDWDVLKMHHLAWIRKNIAKKIENWSSKLYFKKDTQLVPAIIDRYNNYKDGENALVTFNVPGFSVLVNILPRDYVHPHYYLGYRGEYSMKKS